MTTSGNTTVSEVLRAAVNVLKVNKTIETPVLDAEVLLCHVLNCERIFLVINSGKILSETEKTKYFDFIERRNANEPISYITGKKEFMSLDFVVKPGILIPRPDTEILVEEIIKLYNGKKPKIIDICTGSGAIAVSLAHYIKGAKVLALDKYDVCVEAASENSKRNNVSVEVIQGDVFEKLPFSDCDFDCVVSNPPYIEKSTLETLLPDVKNYEPEYALDGGEDGLIFYKRITFLAECLLRSGGILAYEIGYNQAKSVSGIIDMCGHFKNIAVVKDLSGLDRVIIAEKR